jgi:hypothetical protein
MMNKMGLLAGLIVFLAGCAGGGGSIPVVDSGRGVSDETMQAGRVWSHLRSSLSWKKMALWW